MEPESWLYPNCACLLWKRSPIRCNLLYKPIYAVHCNAFFVVLRLMVQERDKYSLSLMEVLAATIRQTNPVVNQTYVHTTLEVRSYSFEQ